MFLGLFCWSIWKFISNSKSVFLYHIHHLPWLLENTLQWISRHGIWVKDFITKCQISLRKWQCINKCVCFCRVPLRPSSWWWRQSVWCWMSSRSGSLILGGQARWLRTSGHLHRRFWVTSSSLTSLRHMTRTTSPRPSWRKSERSKHESF